MASQNQSNENVEECNEVCTLESTTTENTSDLDDKKVTNEDKRLKSDTCMRYCKTCHSQMSEKGREQHKGHGIVSLSTAANGVRQTLEESIKKIKRKNEKLHKSCSENIEQNNDENVKLKKESFHNVLNDEYSRVKGVFKHSISPAKRNRESQFKEYLQDLQNTQSSLDKNIRTLDEIWNEIKKCSDADLLSKEATFNKKMEKCETVQHLPLFDVEETTSLIQVLYSDKDKEILKRTAKEHEQLRKEREYFEKGFETVMSLLKSLLDYRGDNKNGIGFFCLPALPGGIEPRLKKTRMKDRRQNANDDLNRFREIAVNLIDFERIKEQVEVDSNEEPKTKDSKDESTTTGSETQLEETKETTQRVKDQNERMKNVIKTIDKWINICHKSVKQSEVDKIELTLPSEHVMSEKGQLTLETNRKKLEDIHQLLSETCKKSGQIEKEKNYFEQLLHGSFTWLHSVPESEGESEIEITLPDVPKLDDEKRIQDLNKDRDEKQNVLKNIKTILNEHQQMAKECVKLRNFEIEKNFYESSFKETFKALTSIHQSSHRIKIKLPKVPKLEDETKHKEMEKERKDAMNVLKDLKKKIFEEGENLKQMELEKNYFEKACKQILATLTSAPESRQNIEISLPEVPELEDGTKSQEMKEERKKAKDVLNKLLTKDNKEDLKRLKNKLQEAEDKADKAVFEREKTLTRLSEIAGSRLRENNPMIADLSDEYRPTKLAEKHGELYDNEWTDAFQIITTKLKKSDIIAIKMLLKLLKDIYYTCSEMAQKQLKVLLCPIQFEDSEEQIKVPGLLKKVKDFQKQEASDMIMIVEEVMKTKSNKTKERKFGKDLDLCESYIQSCIKLCWMMSVQDPPIVLVFEEKLGENLTLVCSDLTQEAVNLPTTWFGLRCYCMKKDHCFIKELYSQSDYFNMNSIQLYNVSKNASDYTCESINILIIYINVLAKTSMKIAVNLKFY